MADLEKIISNLRKGVGLATEDIDFLESFKNYPSEAKHDSSGIGENQMRLYVAKLKQSASKVKDDGSSSQEDEDGDED